MSAETREEWAASFGLKTAEISGVWWAYGRGESNPPGPSGATGSSAWSAVLAYLRREKLMGCLPKHLTEPTT